MQSIVLDSYNLESAERRLCVEALTSAGNIVGAARLLGLTRHALKRRIVKLGISWSRRTGRIVDAVSEATTMAAAHAA
jgi:transcriptional regulator with GAF, ATPase, and Fis domain